MQNRKKINNQKCDDFVCFAKIANCCLKISKNRYSKTFNRQFTFFDRYNQINVWNKKISTIVCSFSSLKLSIFIATLKQIFKSSLIFEIIISQKNFHFSIYTSKTVSKSKKNESIQCFFISSKLSFQTFESKYQKKFIQKFSKFCSFFINEFVEKLIVTCTSFSQKLSIFFAISRNLISNTKTISQIDSSKRSNFLITTFEITFEYAKNTSNSIAKIAKIAKIFAKSIANIRIQIVRFRIKLEIERTIFQLSTFEFALKSIKKISI